MANTIRPSLRGFMSYLKKRAKAIAQGKDLKDRIRLFAWAILDSMPRIILRAIPFLKPPLQVLKDRLTRGVTIIVGKCMFHLVDSESIFILQPEFEEWMWRYLKVPRGGVFVDVGAHVGKYAIPMAKVVGSEGLVIVVEPHPDNYKQLVENVKLNRVKNVVALNIAAWSEESEMKLFIGDVHGHHSLVYDFGRGFVFVRAKPLDDVLEELGVGRVDCIKVDVEGAELEVLKGMRRTLEKFKPIVVAEVRDENLKRVEDFLHQVRYAMKRVAPMYYILKPM